MARVLSFEEIDPEEATFSEHREYIRRYLATVDDLAGAPLALYRFNPALQRGSAHPDDPAARVAEFRPEQLPGQFPGGYRFKIEVRWSSEIPERKNPLEEPAQIEWSTWDETRPVSIDAEGKPILNTAGSPIVELVENFRRWQIDVQKNVEAVPAWVLEYAGAVNSDDVRIDGVMFEPHSLALQELRIGPVQEAEGVSFRELKLSLQHQPDGWDRRVLNRGFYERRVKLDRVQGVVIDAGITPILDANGEPVTEPRFLDERGIQPRILESDSDGFPRLKIKDPLDPADIVVLKFRTRPALPFRVLPLT